MGRLTAASNKQLDILKYLRDNGCSCTTAKFAAAAGGHLKLRFTNIW
jgi:hypothetical protein